MEMLMVGAGDGLQAFVQHRAGGRERPDLLVDRRDLDFGFHVLVFHRPARQADHLVIAARRGATRRFAAAEGVERRPLVAGAAAEDAAQPQEDHDRDHQKDDRIDVVDVHVAASCPGPGNSARKVMGKRWCSYVGPIDFRGESVLSCNANAAVLASRKTA